MLSRVIFLVLSSFLLVLCGSETDDSRRQLDDKFIGEGKNSGSNLSPLTSDNLFSARPVDTNTGSDTGRSGTSNIREGERRAVTQNLHSLERPAEESHDRENSQGASIPLSNSNNRVTGNGGVGNRSRSESGNGQFQLGPGEKGGFASGSTNYNQQTNFRPIKEGNHFSERPSGSSTFGQSGGYRPGNEGHSSGPSGSSTFGQSGGYRPGNEGLSSGPSGGSSFGQSGGYRPGNEGHSSGPSGSSTFGQSGGYRPGNEGLSSGPSGSSTFGQSGGYRPGNESQGFKKPNGDNATQRPGFGKEPEQSNDGKRPENKPNGENKDGKEDDEDVCFTHLGCFKMGKPWKSTLRPVGAPHAPEKIQTVVHFYSRQNIKQPENITVYPQVNMGRAQFDPQKITAIIVHGFSNSGNATWMKNMKDVYLRKVDANVMIVDWGKGAQLLNYLQVAGNTRVVGKELGTFVNYLITQYGADPGRFHLIGHSLGAQICSYLAKDVPGIARLTALDPAQPGFEGFSKEVRLDQTDAEFVDVIHTDARPFIPTLGFGMMAPHGHVDFYMNGGFDQPGCVPPPKKDLPVIKSFLDFAKFPVEVIAKAVACPHARAYEYLIEAFNETDNCIFWGHKTDVKNVFKTVTNTVTQGLFKKFTALSTTCSKDDCIPLGFATRKSPLRGAFVVTTGGRSPYCISEPGVPPETLPGARKEKSVIEKIKESPFLG